MLGFDGFMWKESVVINRISLFDVPWLMVVALCLLRWIYAPHQSRYLYIAMFFFGVCATIHQTMLVAAMGIEVGIAVALPRSGPRFIFGQQHLSMGWVVIGMITGSVPALNGLSSDVHRHFPHRRHRFDCGVHLVEFQDAADCWHRMELRLFSWVCLWLLGACRFYFYEPLSGMTYPPMQWGYPRTVEGFFHALTRGQYEKSNPTDIFHDPMRFVSNSGCCCSGLAEFI